MRLVDHRVEGAREHLEALALGLMVGDGLAEAGDDDPSAGSGQRISRPSL